MKYRRTQNFERMKFLFLMVGFIVVLLFGFSSQFFTMQENFDRNYKNVHVTFFDHSRHRQNPSGQVLVDGQLVYQTDSISKSLSDYAAFNLKKGKHSIEILTLDGQYRLVDTIEVAEYPIDYKFWITFNYNPPIDEYKQVIIDFNYKRSLKNKNYSDDQKEQLRAQIIEQLNEEFEAGIDYVETKPSFTFTFLDITHYRIE